MKPYIIIFLTLIALQVNAQTPPALFGEISMEEMEMEEYDKDNQAKAVILFDVGETMFYDNEEGYDIRFKREKRIKIFDISVDGITEVAIPFYVDGYGRTEVVKSIVAHTYNLEDGRIIKKSLDPETIFEEKFSESWWVKKFAFPDVKNGSVIEYEYILESPFKFNLPDWEFQSKIPTIYSQYTVRLVPFWEYVYLAQGITSFDYNHSEESKEKRAWGNITESYGRNVGNGIVFNDMIHVFVLKDVPAFMDESYITSINDYIIKIDFQLAKFHKPYGGSEDIITTWPDMNKALLKHDNFGKYINSCQRYCKKVLENSIQIDGLPVQEKCKVIINYVKENYSWNGSQAMYAQKTAKDFYTQKTGNSANVNLFLLAMLKQAGIVAYPIILSTRKHGKINLNYPFDHFFNNVIVFVNDSVRLYSDATEDYLPYDRIPPRCINDKGLLVMENAVNWMPLETGVRSIENIQINITPKPDELKSHIFVTIQATEYDAYYLRLNNLNDTLSLRENYAQIGTINHLSTQNYNRLTIPYVISIEAKKDIEKIGENLIVSPFLHLIDSESKLTQKSRTYPIDLIYKKSRQFTIYLKVPRGYTYDKLPDPVNVNDGLVEITTNYSFQQNTIVIKANYSLKKAIYSEVEYNSIKGYFHRISKLFNQEIVFIPL